MEAPSSSLVRQLLAVGALSFGEFTLASGKRSSYYVDIKRAITRPDILRVIAKSMAPFAARADKVAGVELGAVPIAAALALETGKPFVMVRKSLKEHGLARDCEGELNPGELVLLVEDVVTTGGTLVTAIERIRDHRADIAEAVAVVNRGEGGDDALSAIGVRLHSLLTADDLLAASESGTPR